MQSMEDEAQCDSSAGWAEEEWAEEDEHAGAVYEEDDKMIAAFCHCIYCYDFPEEESDVSFKCRLCDESDEEYVCTVTFGDDIDDGDDELVTTATNKQSLIVCSRALLQAKVFGKQLSNHYFLSTQRSQRTRSSGQITLRTFFIWPLFKRSVGTSKSDPSTLGFTLRAITIIFLINYFVECSKFAFA